MKKAIRERESKLQQVGFSVSYRFFLFLSFSFFQSKVYFFYSNLNITSNNSTVRTSRTHDPVPLSPEQLLAGHKAEGEHSFS